MSSLYSTKMSAYREEGEIKADYQSLSALAVIGFLASLPSPIAFHSTTAAIVPIFAAILNAAALVRIAQFRPTPKGKPLAVMGLCICLFCAGAGITFNSGREAALVEQARYVADQWFDAARQEDFAKLHQLSLKPDVREPDPSPEHLAELYDKMEQKSRELESYVEVEPIPTLGRLKDGVEIKYHSIAKQSIGRSYDRFQFVYLLRFMEDGEKKEGFVALVLKRWREHENLESGWYVESFIADYAGANIHPPPSPTFKGKLIMDPVAD